MLCDVRVLAPAKINIGLRVLPARADGYHGIESIFQTIPLYDKLALQRMGRMDRRCHVMCDGLVLPDKNTLTTAYEVFCEVTGVSESVAVRLEKNIPSGAGLGGGSSDAAALINALDAVYGTNLSPDDRRFIAGKVGSDVFFFVEVGEESAPFCALVQGRGELVSPITPRQDLFFILICPDVHSSTVVAYQLVDEWYSPDWHWDGVTASNLETAYRGAVDTWEFVNSFTAPMEKRYPLIGSGLQDLREVGASFVQMSGSGSAVFGIFESKAAAEKAYLKLREKWRCCYKLAYS